MEKKKNEEKEKQIQKKWKKLFLSPYFRAQKKREKQRKQKEKEMEEKKTAEGVKGNGDNRPVGTH